MDVPDATDSDWLGRANMGTSLSDRFMPFGALSPAKSKAAQKIDRLGPPDGSTTEPGRPRLKGNQQATLSARFQDPATQWQQVCFSQWYGEEKKGMDIASGTALGYHSGEPEVTLRWVLLRDPEGKHEPIAIQCTDFKINPVDIVRRFVNRWQLEVTFEEVRAQLGVETQRQWFNLSIARSNPMLMALFTIITFWADQLFKEQKLTTFQQPGIKTQIQHFQMLWLPYAIKFGGNSIFAPRFQNPTAIKPTLH